MRLLAGREHSIEELRRKLVRKGHPPELIEPVIEKLLARWQVPDRTEAHEHKHSSNNNQD